MQNILTTGSKTKANTLRIIKNVERIESGIASMQHRWWQADTNGENLEFLNFALRKAQDRLAEAQALLKIPTSEQTQRLVRRFAEKPLNKGTE